MKDGFIKLEDIGKIPVWDGVVHCEILVNDRVCNRSGNFVFKGRPICKQHLKINRESQEDR